MVKVEALDPESFPSNFANTSRKHKSTELVVFDENRETQYQGYCKLQVNVLSKFLLVKPINEDFRDITATFDWKFIKQKNIIFVFAKHESQDFALFFKDEEKCSHVYNGIFKKRDKDTTNKELIRGLFLISIFKRIPKNGPSRLKELMRRWIRKHDETEKNEYFQLLRDNYNEDQGVNDSQNVKQEDDSKSRVNRKRKDYQIKNKAFASGNKLSVCEDLDDRNHLTDNNDYVPVSSIKSYIFVNNEKTKIIDESNFKIVNFKYQNGEHRKLLIFSSDDKTHCYEFYFRANIFYHCCDKQNKIKAILRLDENGNECIEFEDKKHVCSPKKYDPERYIELKVVKKPNYEIFENCLTQSRRMLIIFDPNDRSQCYEYYWCKTEKKFQCCGCASKRKDTLAIICHENTETEHIKLIHDKHICEIRNYNPKKYSETNKFVLSPNFEIQTKIKGGSERKHLIIFDENDRTLCYLYYFQKSSNLFYCNGCIVKRKAVYARLCQNSDGEEYVILSTVKHICSLRSYLPQKSDVILRSPTFKFVEATEKTNSKLIIFDSIDPKLCFKFSHRNDNLRRYFCLGCFNERRNKKKEDQKKRLFIVHLYKNDNASNDDEYYVQMNGNRKHICKPKKYEPEKYEMTTLKPKEDYILFQKNEKKKVFLALAIFIPNDKRFCYKYFYHKNGKQFRCSGCQTKKTHTSAKIQHGSDGNEYIVTNQKKHVCKPVKVSSIVTSDAVILENSGIYSEEPQKETKEIDESRIVRLPNFELQRNKNGVQDKKLIVFKSYDKTLCYIYRWQSNCFFCNKCRNSAKLQADEENSEKYLILSENKHTCKPVKYESEVKFIAPSSFMIFNQDDESKPTKLIVFTSSTKEFCYEYTFNKHEKTFQCCECLKNHKKKITAKLEKNANNEERIQPSTKYHLCTPKKFKLEMFQPKIVPESGFVLFSNKNGKPNSHLILYDSTKDGFVYEYRSLKNKFTCNGCILMKKQVTAKVHEKENGEKYLELSPTEHICKAVKYDPKKLVEKKIIYENFVVHHNKSGAPNSRLTVLNDNDKNFGYQYAFYGDKFRCCGCECFKKAILAKLLIDENGKQYVEFGKQEHSCSMRNLKEKNLIFDAFKFEENENVLITMNSNISKHCYKFKYDSNLDVFCCTKCKEIKKKIITATICKDKNEKEFVLLNDCHVCASLSK